MSFGKCILSGARPGVEGRRLELQGKWSLVLVNDIKRHLVVEGIYNQASLFVQDTFVVEVVLAVGPKLIFEYMYRYIRHRNHGA